ncbi:hypothetical protein GO011_09490 [Mycobacterium sp. 20091114027_K0903767]|nr:hypothetical protein [Mycobacterium sp. 20091114027_K0903767]
MWRAVRSAIEPDSAVIGLWVPGSRGGGSFRLLVAGRAVLSWRATTMAPQWAHSTISAMMRSAWTLIGMGGVWLDLTVSPAAAWRSPIVE